ncbi:MAG: glycerol-3-phosphate 1-O-acyltransferase PlsY [Anaerolineales bacterium]
MQFLLNLGLILLGYLLGSIPFGLIIVKLKTGKDIRNVESGRTGGTNALRAAGFWAGLATAVMDILKGAAAVWIAQAFSPSEWVHILAPIAAILGHNYSIYLPERDASGKITRLRGGAGGAPAVGGALGLWPISVLLIVPLGAAVFFGLGYASVTTISVAFFAILIFALRAAQGLSPWTYVLYGVIAEILLIWALRPNIQKLFSGNERVVNISLHGLLRARQEKKRAEK